MTTVVVYESIFGNTRRIASAIAEGRSPFGPVVTANVNDKLAREATRSADLLVLGGPTHVHGMTRPCAQRSTPEWTWLASSQEQHRGTSGTRSRNGVRSQSFRQRASWYPRTTPLTTVSWPGPATGAPVWAGPWNSSSTTEPRHVRGECAPWAGLVWEELVAGVQRRQNDGFQEELPELN